MPETYAENRLANLRELTCHAVSCESIELAFRMTCQLSSAEDSRISSIDDASELFLGLLKQVHIANDPGVDLEALANATAGKPRVRT